MAVADVAGVEIAGLDVAATGGDAIALSSTAAGSVGADVHDNAISGASGVGISIAQDGSGTSTVTIADNTIAAAGNGLGAATTAGELDLAFDRNTGITSVSDSAAMVDGSVGGTLYVTSFADNQVAGATGGDGLRFDTVVFDADPSDADFTGDTVDGGATVVGASGDPVAGGGLALTNVSGDLSFSSLTAYSGTGLGLAATGSGTFSAGGGTGFRLSAPAGAIDAANGPGVALGTSTLMLDLSSVSCGANSLLGIYLQDTDGTFNVPSGSIATSSGATGGTFTVDGGSVSVTYGGSMTNAGNNLSVSVTGMTGGTVVLSGDVIDTSTGISMTGNDSTTSVTLSGTLTLTTTTHRAFTATGAGTVTVTDPSNANAITTTTGDGIDIDGVAIGASGVQFSTVNVGPNAANGILLTNVGGNPFTVTGGSIQSVTTRGLDVSGGSGNVSVGASISTTSAGRSVEVTGHTGGVVALSGALDDNGLGVNLGSNTGATIDFTGNMSINTVGANTGFNATGGGTVNVSTGPTTSTPRPAPAWRSTSTAPRSGEAGSPSAACRRTERSNGITLEQAGPPASTSPERGPPPPRRDDSDDIGQRRSKCEQRRGARCQHDPRRHRHLRRSS